MTNGNPQWQQSAPNWQDPQNSREQTNWQTNSQNAWQQQNSWHANSQQQQWNRQPGLFGITSEERTWAILAHISAIIATFISAGWLSFIGPLLVWAIKKDSSAYVRNSAAQSFNFNLSLWILNALAWVLFFTIILIPIAILIWISTFILLLWHHIRAVIAASNNRVYHYPLQLKILS
ncbi:DUF4870 domain-containing protein [Arcanobacterium hippocoleae]